MARKPADQSVSREDIILAAADVLQRKGYEATTMKDIAAAVNLTAASLYHHFRNKDSLLLAVMEAGLELILGRIRPIVYDDLPSDHKLQQMICAHVIGVTQNTAVGAAMVFEIRSLLDVKSPPATASTADHQSYAEFLERRAAFFTARDEFEYLFRQVIREGVQNGTFRPVDDGIFTNTLLGAHNWVGIWYKPSGRLSGDEIAAMMAEFFLRGLKA
ncbi:MAG: TetR/AcrR family transcriptional regulator [Anaerolineae bacterium]|nr:TetR/AcrR family transcriptional regulator [Anaerolineae bacterium]